MGDDDKPVDYKVPEKVGIHDLVNRDKDDESLENYKKQLLGNTTDFYSRKFRYIPYFFLKKKKELTLTQFPKPLMIQEELLF